MGDYLFGGGSLLDVLPWRPFAYGIIAVLVPVLVGLIVMLVFGFTTARVAGEKGRNAVGWFFIGFSCHSWAWQSLLPCCLCSTTNSTPRARSRHLSEQHENRTGPIKRAGWGRRRLAFHLASLFASDGRSVLAVDLDPQGNLTSCFLRSGVQHANHAAVLFQGGFPQPLRVADHVDLVGADSELGRYEDHSATDGLYAVRTWLERDNAHDCVILDTPPGHGPVYKECPPGR